MKSLADHPDFMRLHSLSEDLNTNYSCAFGEIGLGLEGLEGDILDIWSYDSDPLNKLTFASTGGDGVHFSFVLLDDIPFKDSPVVMTVPMNFGDENMILGENLREFLALGCSSGYFFLEQLSYDLESEIIELERHREEPDYYRDDEDTEYVARIKLFMGHIRAEFNISPWPEHSRRLSDLQCRFMSKLKLRNSEQYG